MIRLCATCGADRCVCIGAAPVLAPAEPARQTDPDDTIRRSTLTIRIIAMVAHESADDALSILVSALKLKAYGLMVSEADLVGLVKESGPGLRTKGWAS